MSPWPVSVANAVTHLISHNQKLQMDPNGHLSKEGVLPTEPEQTMAQMMVMIGNSGMIYEEVLCSTVWTSIVQDNQRSLVNRLMWVHSTIINCILVQWRWILYSLLCLLDPILCTDGICCDLYMRMLEFHGTIINGVLIIQVIKYIRCKRWVVYLSDDFIYLSQQIPLKNKNPQ